MKPQVVDIVNKTKAVMCRLGGDDKDRIRWPLYGLGKYAIQLVVSPGEQTEYGEAIMELEKALD